MDQNNEGVAWRTSSYSDGLQCVELAAVDGSIAVRDSKNPAGPTLHFTKGEMDAFVKGAKAGEFDDLI